MKNNKNNNIAPLLTIGALIAITGISGCVLRSNIVSAEGDSVTDTVAITVPVSCTMSGNIDTAHTATINNGIYSGASGSEYENGIGKTTLTTFCNDQNGFSIYAIGFTNDTAGNTNLAGTAASGNANIATGTATSGSTSNWAMKVNKVDNPVSGDPVTYNPENMTITSDTEGLFSSYHTVPNTYTKVAEYHALTGSSSTDIGTNALGAKITTTYAAYISPTQPADTYTGQVKYVMVHPYDHVAPITPPTPPTSCTTPVQGVTYMQELATMTSAQKAAVLTSITEDNQYYLADNRDNKTYCVAKLRDGNIWMTQNLDFDIVNGGANMNSTNTDVPANWADGGNLIDTYDAANDTVWDARWGAVSDPYSNPQSYDPGTLYWNGQLYTNSGTVSIGDSHYHLGNYYSWTAAVAMADSSSYTADNTDVDQSICPAGWTLPKNGNNTSSGSFQYMLEQYGWNDNTSTLGNDAKTWNTPLYFPLSGYWNGTLRNVGSYGYYWSPVVNSSSYAYYSLSFYVGFVTPGDYSERSSGFNVRCVTR